MFVVRKKKEVVSISEKPWKSREDVKKEIRLCGWAGGITEFVGLVFAVLGVIGDALNITLGLESMSWFLLAIVAALLSITPNMRQMVATHLYGIESEIKKQE